MNFAVLSFRFFIVAMLLSFVAGCSQQGTYDNNVNVNRPLTTPEIKNNSPKIVALGDSLTAGFGLAADESYPFLLQKKLDADGYRYEVINAGISGDTSLGGLERADWTLEQENVEILILALGANDMLRGMPVAAMKNNLSLILEKAKKRNIKVLLCGMLAPDSLGAEYRDSYRDVFITLAKDDNVTLLPFLLENIALIRELNQADGIHPNARGTEIMANNVYMALLPMLQK